MRPIVLSVALAAVALVAVSCRLTFDAGTYEPAYEGSSPSAPAQPAVVVNGVQLDWADIERIAASTGARLPPGRFWYDAVSGAWGFEGGATRGFTRSGLEVGGPLRADASGGGFGSLTGVFVNGRELHPLDVAALSELGPVVPGRYWVDAFGNFGYEGQPFALGNLVQLANASASRGNSYLRRTQAGYLGSDGQTSYFFDPETGASVIPGEGLSY